MNKSHQTFKQRLGLSRVKSLAKNNSTASITGRKWACESLQIHQQVRRSYWDTKAETSSPKPKRWIFGPLFGSGDFRGADFPEPWPSLLCGMFLEVDLFSLLEFFWARGMQLKRRLTHFNVRCRFGKPLTSTLLTSTFVFRSGGFAFGGFELERSLVVTFLDLEGVSVTTHETKGNKGPCQRNNKGTRGTPPRTKIERGHVKSGLEWPPDRC